jgi:hypothetical protein
LQALRWFCRLIRTTWTANVALLDTVDLRPARQLGLAHKRRNQSPFRESSSPKSALCRSCATADTAPRPNRCRRRPRPRQPRNPVPMSPAVASRAAVAVGSGEVSWQSEGRSLDQAFLCSHGGMECQVFTVVSTNRPQRAWLAG